MADEPAQHRIAKLLARAGVASRRDVERMITDGRVAVNGVVVATPATLLETLDGVTVDGAPVAPPEPTRLFLFHKPAGYLTAARDPAGRPTIYDRLPADLPRLVPVGRLDLNTEGLLLLTTDGEFKRQLELPSTGVERAYRARAYGDVTQAQLEDLIDGVEIEGIRYGSIDANLERRTGANVWVEMILTEGKNREVRRVLEYLGLQVSRLIRTRYGPFVLGDLPVGGIGEVRGVDLVAFRQSLKAGARGKGDDVATISAPALRRAPAGGASRTRATDQSTSSSAGYDPAAAPRRADASEPDRRLRRSDPPPPSRVRSQEHRSTSLTHDGPQNSRGAGTRGGERVSRSSANGRAIEARVSPLLRDRDQRAEVERRTRGPGMSTHRDNPRSPSIKSPPSRSERSNVGGREEEAVTTRPPKLQRKAGWAKPKPKTGPRSGKPRK